jgi:type I restriction enzyme, S subunit
MSAIEKLITENLPIWSSSVQAKSTQGRGSSSKRHLYGVKKLRELILDLAVRGLLVPQDPNDEPASVLLEKIAAEKEQLIKDGKIKRQKLLPENKDELFKIPSSWAWQNLGDTGFIGSSSRVHKKDWMKSGVPFYRAREIVKLSKDGVVDNELYISEELFDELSKKGIMAEPNDLMITGVGTIGTPYIVKTKDKFYFKDASVLIYKNIHQLQPYFLNYFFQSPFWKLKIHEKSMGTTVHTLTIGRANEAPIPIPPLAEQHRIVAKVDELMALCDTLEQQQEDSIQAHETLVETLLSALTNAPDADAFQSAWQRVSAHFDTLLTTEHSVDKLKETILQLAVMGKLVPQDPNDEPATTLLEKIKPEVKRIIKSEKFSVKDITFSSTNNHQFKIPKNWVWCKLNDLAAIARGGSPRPIKAYITEDSSGLNWIKISDSTRGSRYITSSVQKIKKEGLSKTREVFAGDLILSNSMSFGYPYIMKISGCIHDGWLVLRSPDEMINKIFLYNLFLSPYAKKCFSDVASGAVVQNLNADKVKLLDVALPPLAEQYRIVAKVDELIALCDDLKRQLNEAQTTQMQLTDAVTEQAVN